MEHVAQVAFNEIQLATDHTSNNDTKVKRAIVTFKQAGMLVDGVSLPQIANNNKLIVDISKISPWNHSEQCYLMLDVFRSGTMQVEKRRFCTQYVQIKYFEASWPLDPVAHRIIPNHGSMQAYSQKRGRSDDEVQTSSQNYAVMLDRLMALIQNYLLLGSSTPIPEDNMICIGLEDLK